MVHLKNIIKKGLISTAINLLVALRDRLSHGPEVDGAKSWVIQPIGNWVLQVVKDQRGHNSFDTDASNLHDQVAFIKILHNTTIYMLVCTLHGSEDRLTKVDKHGAAGMAYFMHRPHHRCKSQSARP